MNIPHFSELAFVQAQRYGKKNAFWHQHPASGEWIPTTWETFAEQVRNMSKAFHHLGLCDGQTIGICSQNKPETFVVDFAAFAIGGVVVPMYATSSAQQIEYIVNDAGITTIFVGEQYQYDIAYQVLQTSSVLKKIIVFDPLVRTHGEDTTLYFHELMQTGINSTAHFEVHNYQESATEDQLATIMYTSGTTGEPKGVMLTHSNYLEAMRIHTVRLTSITDKDRSIAFLPLTHIFERTWCYFCLLMGVEIYLNLRPQEIQATVREVRPSLICAVPRFWEKVYIVVQQTLESYTPFKRGLVAWAVAVGEDYNLKHLRLGKKPSPYLCLRYFIADKLIFSKVKKTIGIENANILPTAGAAISDEIVHFFRSIGMPIMVGYGLTESTATVTCYPYTLYKIGTVGTIMPDVEVKISDEDEILIKGKTITKGYYNKPEVNAATFTEDGFFRTGDSGRFEDGHLILTERIKDLFKTSNGKYIAPQQTETRLSKDMYIEQVAVIGDQRNYVTALIVPNFDNLKQYAANKKIANQTIEELLHNPEIIDFYLGRIKEAQKDMASFEQIKKITLIKKAFTLEAGELTNTLKLRRAVIMQKYKDVIELMYL